MTTEELKARVAALTWWHTIDLGNGVVTPGKSQNRELLAVLGMPDDLTGKTVLDIGAWDGFFSFEAEKRGATCVVAADKCVWEGGCSYWPIPVSDAAFDLAYEVLGSKVEKVVIDAMNIDKLATPNAFRERNLKGRRFDLVLFLGILYHLRHPLLAMEKVFAVSAPGGHVIVETHVDTAWGEEGIPRMRFYPGKELAGDPTNWWGPNPACVRAMMQDAGFVNIRESPWVPGRAIFHGDRPT